MNSENKIKTPKNNNIISSIFTEYCSKTSVHGIGYLGDKNKGIFEKFWWIFVFGISVAVCVIQMIYLWTKWKENPVIMTVSESQFSVWTIPFPAVTICPFNKIDRRKYKYREQYIIKDISHKLDKKFWDLSLLCNERFQNYTIMTNESVIDHIYQAATSLKSIFEHSPKLNGKNIHFYHHITEDGLCFTYNSFNQNDMYTNQLNSKTKLIENGFKNEGWSIENGYPKNSESYTIYPNRTREGVKLGMKINLKSFTISREFACGEPILGYKIMLHNPAEAPRGGQEYVLVPIKKSTVISVKPNVIKSSNSLKNLPVQTRNCYFSNEKSLRFFKVYTQNNCKSECVINVTKEFCGCVAFYMPRDNDTKICGTVDCITDLETEILGEFDFIENIENLNFERQAAFEIYQNCDCRPSCATLDYDYDSSQADYNWQQGFEKKRDILRAQIPLSWMEYTSVNIFFKDSQFMALQRKELFNQTDFLANCGGLLGLFIGCSFLSLIEIIYFFTIRLLCKLKYDI